MEQNTRRDIIAAGGAAAFLIALVLRLRRHPEDAGERTPDDDPLTSRQSLLRR